MPDPERQRRELSDVLADEYRAIKGPARANAAAGGDGSIENALKTAVNEVAARKPPPRQLDRAKEQAKRKRLYKIGYQLNLSALCLSGGGIRSAAISLGVIQALADHQLLDKFEYLSTVSGGGYIGSWLSAWLYRVRKAGGSSDGVLKRLGSHRNAPDVEVPPLDHLREYSNYLTPKLGFFSADTWAAVAIVLRNIVVNWLILLPTLAILVTLVKLIALGLTAPAFRTPGIPLAGWHVPWTGPEVLAAVVCLVTGALALGYKLSRLYLPSYKQVHPDEDDLADQKAINAAQSRFIFWSLIPVVIGGFCFVWLADNKSTPGVFLHGLLPDGWVDALNALGGGVLPEALPALVVFAIFVYGLALLIGLGLAAAAAARQHRTVRRRWVRIFVRRRLPASRGALKSAKKALRREVAAVLLLVLTMRDWLAATRGDRRRRAFNFTWSAFFSWSGAILVFALMIFLGARGITSLGDPITGAVSIGGVAVQREALIVIFGLPWFLLATILGHDIYLLLDSTSPRGDVEREWLGRGSGWHFIIGLAWIMLSVVVLLGPAVYYYVPQTVHVLTVVSGAVTALLGKSGLTSATGGKSDWKGFAANIGLALAGPLFAVLLLILLSVVIDWLVFGYHLPCLPTNGHWDRCHGDVWWWPYSLRWLLPLGISAVTLGLADGRSNVNAYSLHSVYRNRLIRCFLGGARDPHRHPDGFTDFDWDDDLRVADLWRLRLKRGEWRPFHVINMTLNLADTNRLAWQQRKAMPFSVTPLFCGNADLGYRPTKYYAGPKNSDDHQPVAVGAPAQPGEEAEAPEIRTGISLGTAMAISGAAVSSNMGYHSSMSLSFLLTFFNVRLGVWLGNPGDAGQRSIPFARPPYESEGPAFAVRPLLSELFGMTSADSPHVYLSDGGHFEDLGLYEMVRRRCRRILIVDGDQDGKRGFADLGNAVRKIWIDLGVRISFAESKLLAANDKTEIGDIPYFAVGTIDYVSDELDAAERQPQGHILYIKPVVRGDENAADVIAYQRANPTFPAQSTANQWFDESQFESYRRLGHLMAEQIIVASGVKKEADQSLAALFRCLDNIEQQTMGPKKA